MGTQEEGTEDTLQVQMNDEPERRVSRHGEFAIRIAERPDSPFLKPFFLQPR